MHRLNHHFITSLFLILTTPSCDAFRIDGSGTIETIEPDLNSPGSIEEFDLDSGLEATVARGDPELRITGDDNLLDELIVRQDGDRLFIGLPDSVGGYRPTQPIAVELSLPDIERMVLSGGASMRLEGAFEDTYLDIEMSGGGTLEARSLRAKSLDLEASGGSELDLKDLALDEIRLDVSGGGEAALSGKVDTLEARLDGGGLLDAIECEARAVSLDLSGGADASVHATEVLDVRASGGGTIVYRGDPETINKDLSGGAELEQED